MRLELDPQALEDLQFWTKTDARKARKTLELIDAVLRDPFTGIGKPEPLKHGLSGCWSRRIDHEHRLVYRVANDVLVVLSCRYHYSSVNDIETYCFGDLRGYSTISESLDGVCVGLIVLKGFSLRACYGTGCLWRIGI